MEENTAKVALINHAAVDATAIATICETTRLPQGEILLIVGDRHLASDFQAITIPRYDAEHAANLYGLQDCLDRHWDCGVSIGAVWSEQQSRFPAYFAYLLGHEFGHATTVLTDVGIAIFEELVLKSMPRVVPDRKWRWDEMPHEVCYDQFGLSIAETIHGRDQIEREFERIIADELPADALRLRKVLQLQPANNVSNVRSALAEFAAPYKDDLMRLWEAERSSGRLRMARDIPDLGMLWDAI